MKKILIVDDAIFMRLTIKKMLENSNYEVVGEAANGVIGVELYKQLQPDIVTMDITMPEMTGIEALKAIKAINPKAMVVMLTALGQEGMVKEAIISGAKNYLVKPFTEERLLQVLDKLG
ncbi:response regulator [Desulfosporosinus hippei]|uniref:Stage 0 sporulation protein A homolog n=1 Tax=Desulfosporosinus hippei DSM 8344 TaxID=1121419 RepID=A0A1G7WAT6_9FIRM|nr:response regulator [Desulfosporosinus hippei]SDG69107.1 two-component system, chemotaxis family, response regulator CheY [Desulfosporosinus hippei DSM 8344]